MRSKSLSLAVAFLLLLTVWYLAPELSHAFGGDGVDRRRVTYTANGLFSTAICLLWREALTDKIMRGVALLAAYLWVLQPVCSTLYVPNANGVDSVCNVVFQFPLSEFIGAGIVVFAGWLWDKKLSGKNDE